MPQNPASSRPRPNQFQLLADIEQQRQEHIRRRAELLNQVTRSAPSTTNENAAPAQTYVRRSAYGETWHTSFADIERAFQEYSIYVRNEPQQPLEEPMPAADKKCSDCGAMVTKLYTKKKICLNCLKLKPDDIQVHAYNENVLHLRKPNIRESERRAALFKKIATPITMGIELEWNNDPRSTEDARRVLSYFLKDHIIYKRDGSLREGGFELVTVPATLGVHLDLFKQAFAELPKTLKSEEGTGMHVHIGKSCVSKLTLARIIDFMNNEKNKSLMEQIGERRLNNYCNIDPSRDFGYLLTNGGGARYNVLNIAKAETFEFRMFQTPIKFDKFAKNLEFIHAIIDYMQAGWTSWTPKETRDGNLFLKFIRSQNQSKLDERNKYPHLHLFLQERNDFYKAIV